MSAIYRLQGLGKSYNGRQIVHIDDLAIERGEIFALVGPSGAGKSTLLRLLNFLESPTQGRVWFDDTWLTAAEAAPLALRRRVTMVFQRPLLVRGSVAYNVGYGLRLRGLPRNGLVSGLLRRMGLDALEQAPASNLSGGEVQRVALARALAFQPQALLLDEPTANLDPYNVSLIENMVREANAAGVTVLLVTHNVFQARRLAHRVGLLLNSGQGGRLVEVAPVRRFFEAPQDARTAAFIRGDMVY